VDIYTIAKQVCRGCVTCQSINKKTWKDDKLQPILEGPYQVLLTTETAIRTTEKGRMHYNQEKELAKASQGEGNGDQ
jgi:hypothetical protein